MKASHDILNETLSVKLKYEKIIKQVMEEERVGEKTRPIEEIIRNTTTPRSLALNAIKNLLPDLQPSPLATTSLPKKKQQPRKKAVTYDLTEKAIPAAMAAAAAKLPTRKSMVVKSGKKMKRK